MSERPWTALYPPGLPARGRYPEAPLWWPLETGARDHPERVALSWGDAQLDYAALWLVARRWAGALREAGLGPGDRAQLELPNGPAFVGAFFGTLLAGGIAVPLSPSAGATARAALRRDAEPALRLAADAEEGTLVVDPLAAEPPGSPPPFAPSEPPAPEQTAVLQYTSGTTGLPKGAQMTHANLVANALQNARWFGWTAEDRQLLALPLVHTWGLCCGLNSTLAVGGTLRLATRAGAFDGAALLRELERWRGTILYGSATMIERLIEARDAGAPCPGSLRHVKAGAMLSQGQLKARWDERFPRAPLQQGYGLTEASPESHNNPPQAFKPGTVGVPIQDTDCRIADPAEPGRALPAGSEGEVQLRGPQIFSGYWRREQASAAAFSPDGWLRTGDLGRMDGEGYLTIVDRLKDLIKVRGYSVAPALVEERLRQHPGVGQTVVVGAPCPRDGERVVAFVVPRAGARPEAAALAAFAADGLARAEAPSEVRLIEEIPRNAVGKPLRRALREQLAQEAG